MRFGTSIRFEEENGNKYKMARCEKKIAGYSILIVSDKVATEYNVMDVRTMKNVLKLYGFSEKTMNEAFSMN